MTASLGSFLNTLERASSDLAVGSRVLVLTAAVYYTRKVLASGSPAIASSPITLPS